MDSDPQYTFDGINEIRERALMLSLGNEYLCKDIFLKKMGVSIALNVKELASDISSLKSNSPGKSGNVVEADQILKGMYRTARRLQEPDDEISKKCSVGVLGRELEASVNSLARVLKAMRHETGEEEPVYPEPEPPAPAPVRVEVEEKKPVYTEPEPVAVDAVRLEVEEEKPVYTEPEPEFPAAETFRLEIEEEKPVYTEPEPVAADAVRLEIEEEKPVYTETEARLVDAISIEYEQKPPVRTRAKAPATGAARFPAKERRAVRRKPGVSFSPLGWIRSLGHMIAATVTFIVKLFVTLTLVPLIAVMICIVPFTYLYVTMESEEKLLEGISRSQTYIQTQQEILATLDYQKIDDMSRRELSRQEKVEVMDLYVNIHKLDEERSNLQVEIQLQEQKIEEKQERIEEIKEKSFVERLLRQ
jgi:hypothetical protein